MNRPDGKKRILLVASFLRFDRVISCREIIRKLDLLWDMKCDRKTIYDDSRVINQITPVETIAGRNGGYRRVDVAWECDHYDNLYTKGRVS